MKLRKISAVAVAASAVAFGTALMFSGTATATTDPTPTTTVTDPPKLGEEGKQADGSPANAATCAQAGLGGSILLGDEAPNMTEGPAGEGTTGGDPESLTLLINPGYEITGVVVKGGPGYIVYGPFGPSSDYIQVFNLLPPVNPGDQNPTISHWFVCGDPDDEETTTTTTTTGTTTTTTGTTTTTTGTTTATTGTTTTTTPGLPLTGAGLTGLLVAAVALIAGGGTMLVLLRRRRAAAGE